jgi:TetR/AcrR family transcriptional regulator
VTQVRRSKRGDLGVAILAAGGRVAAARGTDLTTQDVIREAQVSIQTFYRYFRSRDRLVLALIDDWIRQYALRLTRSGNKILDPVDRLEMYVRRTLAPASTPEFATAARFVTSEHWRLHQHFPAEMTHVDAPFIELLRRDIEAAVEAGRLASRSPASDAIVMTRTILGSFHHLSFFADGPGAESIADDVWNFCFTALGGTVAPRSS